jgi:hypothetical protein
VTQHLVAEGRDIDGKFERLMIHSGAELADIGEADAELQQRRKFMRLVAARRDADLVDRAPEAIAGTGVVMACRGRALAGGGADEHEAEVRLELVGEFFQVVRAVKSKSNVGGE